MTQHRQPAGIRTGGQFAASERAEADVRLAPADQKYRVVRSVDYSPSSFALAHRYTELADALHDMGTGIVVGDDGHVAAFHESQERFVTHRLASSSKPQE